MTLITLDIEIYCATCGAGLCDQTEGAETRNRHQPCYRVEPCSNCIAKARDEGYDNGYDEGYGAGVNEASP